MGCSLLPLGGNMCESLHTLGSTCYSLFFLSNVLSIYKSISQLTEL
jgi:hypothetical protein